MLCLSRDVGDSILIGDSIRIVITKQEGRHIGIGIEAPREVKILRGELANAPSQRSLNRVQSESQPPRAA